jgi:hypothetical protein
MARIFISHSSRDNEAAAPDEGLAREPEIQERISLQRQ